MKNNKGFAISSVVYAMLILFLGLILLILGNLASRKAMFDKEKNEILMRFNGDESDVVKYNNGEVVYFNVTTGEKCTSSDYTETQSNTGVNSGCMKFYAFNDNGGDIVNLLLDHNTTSAVAWNSSGSNASGPKEILTQLKSDTSSWKGTVTPSNYTIDQTGQTSNAKYTIDYSEYKARLITANEIAAITGNTSWDEKNASSLYYFDSKTSSASDTCTRGNTSGCSYRWLYDRTKTSCTTYGCLNNSDANMTGIGYWTASSRADDSKRAWGVGYGGYIDYGSVGYNNFDGVRPVIEVLKSKLNTLNIICTSVTESTKTQGNVPQGNFSYGDEYTCELGDNDTKTFFVLETNGDNVSLIMNANVDSNGKAITPSNIPADKGLVAWISKDDYIAAGGNDFSNIDGSGGMCEFDSSYCSSSEYGPITAEAALKTRTKGWTKLVSSQVTLPTGQQVATAGGDTEWTESNYTGKTLSTWLYDNLSGTTNSVSGVNGYLMSNFDPSTPIYAFAVYSNGKIGNIGTAGESGIRPVITISKSNLG